MHILRHCRCIVIRTIGLKRHKRHNVARRDNAVNCSTFSLLSSLPQALLPRVPEVMTCFHVRATTSKTVYNGFIANRLLAFPYLLILICKQKKKGANVEERGHAFTNFRTAIPNYRKQFVKVSMLLCD